MSIRDGLFLFYLGLKRSSSDLIMMRIAKYNHALLRNTKAGPNFTRGLCTIPRIWRILCSQAYRYEFLYLTMTVNRLEEQDVPTARLGPLRLKFPKSILLS